MSDGMKNMIKKLAWYENIEPGIREVVFLLRNNGYNTTCSCEHEMLVQGHFDPTDDLYMLDTILFNAGYEQFILDIRMERTKESGVRRWFDLRLPKEDGTFTEWTALNHDERIRHG